MERSRMQRSIVSLVVGASAVVLAAVAIPPVVATAGAQTPPTVQTFTLTPTGATVTLLGTTSWTPTAPAGPASTIETGGTHPLSGVTASAAHVPDAGIYGQRGETIAATPGSRGALGEKHGPTGHLTTVTGTPVSGPTAGLAAVDGTTAYDQGVLHPRYLTHTAQPLPGVDVEPPDQGLCAGNGYVMEVNNMVAQVFSSSTMRPVSTYGMALEKLFGTPEVFGGTGGGTFSVQGDPRCYYDPSSNRWFASQLWLTEVDGSPTFGWAGAFVAVSTTTSPLGSWRVYFVPDQFDAMAVDGCNNKPLTTLPPPTKAGTTHLSGYANPCFGDQPLLGVNGDAVFISVNEYSLYTATGPGGVATEYVLSKADLLAGTPSPIYWGHLGDTVTRPGASTTCPFGSPAAVHCPWYSIVPAVSDGAYVTSTAGTFYSLSAVTFTTTGGSRVAVWQFTNTDAVTTGGAHVTGAVRVVTTVPYTEPPFASQRSGPTPLGASWEKLVDQRDAASTLPPRYPHPTPLPEGPIATNTDRMTTAAYDPATGALWGGLDTGLTTTNSAAAGVLWVTATPSGSGSSLTAAGVSSGYLAAKGADIQFPSIGFTTAGAGVMDYSLSGSAYYPSTAYSLMTSTGPAGVHMASPGAGPQDGFTEYTAAYGRPRWGDYSTALATGSTFFFASEKIDQSCSPGQFKATFTCGGTRDLTANWGTGVIRLPG